MFERIGVVFSFGVQNSGSLWHFLIRHVMVADDEVYAQLFGVFNFFYRLYSTVEYYYQSHTRFVGEVDTLTAHSISLVVAVGNVVVDVGVILL